jgi:hypothetical protein
MQYSLKGVSDNGQKKVIRGKGDKMEKPGL